MLHTCTVDAELSDLYRKGYQPTGSASNVLPVQRLLWECFL
jgi:hypothetical protein